jgi:hypothetical protein
MASTTAGMSVYALRRNASEHQTSLIVDAMHEGSSSRPWLLSSVLSSGAQADILSCMAA